MFANVFDVFRFSLPRRKLKKKKASPNFWLVVHYKALFLSNFHTNQLLHFVFNKLFTQYSFSFVFTVCCVTPRLNTHNISESEDTYCTVCWLERQDELVCHWLKTVGGHIDSPTCTSTGSLSVLRLWALSIWCSFRTRWEKLWLNGQLNWYLFNLFKTFFIDNIHDQLKV